MNLNIEDLKNQQRWLVHKGRELLSDELHTLGRQPQTLSKIDEGKAITDLLYFIDSILAEEVLGAEEITIKFKKSS